MKPESYIYLASPYSHPDSAIQQSRYDTICKIVIDLAYQGIVTFSPIMYMHPSAVKYNLPTTATHWRKFNYTMLSKASKMLIVKIDGWDSSKGIDQELQDVYDLNIPFDFMEYKP